MHIRVYINYIAGCIYSATVSVWLQQSIGISFEYFGLWDITNQKLILHAQVYRKLMQDPLSIAITGDLQSSFLPKLECYCVFATGVVQGNVIGQYNELVSMILWELFGATTFIWTKYQLYAPQRNEKAVSWYISD